MCLLTHKGASIFTSWSLYFNVLSQLLYIYKYLTITLTIPLLFKRNFLCRKVVVIFLILSLLNFHLVIFYL